MENQVELLKEGKAAFEIDSISDRDAEGNFHKSKAGNMLIKGRLHVTDADGMTGTVWLNIPTQMLFKLRDICESVGMANVYKDYKTHKEQRKGQLALEELIGQEGCCELVIKRDEQYGDKMDVKRFLPKVVGHGKPNVVNNIEDKGDSEDDLPF